MSDLEASEHAEARPRDEKPANTATARSRKSTMAALTRDSPDLLIRIPQGFRFRRPAS
jgi:hypothetical protein